MTFPSSGLSNQTQQTLGISAARVTTSIVPGASFPTELYHSADNSAKVPPDLLNLYNLIWTQINSTYRL